MRSRGSPTWSPGKAASRGPSRCAMSDPSRSTSRDVSGGETTTRSRSECSSIAPVMNEPPTANPARRASAWNTGSARSRKARCSGGVTGRAVLLLSPPAHRSRLARQLELLAGVGDPRPVDFEDGDVAIGVVADVQILPVGAEDHALRQAAHFHLADLGDLLAIDVEHGQTAISLGVEPRVLGDAGAAQQHGHRHIALRADCEA